MATAGEIGKQLVARTPEVAGGLLRQLIDFGIDGNDTAGDACPACDHQTLVLALRDESVGTVGVVFVVAGGDPGELERLRRPRRRRNAGQQGHGERGSRGDHTHTSFSAV